MAAVSRLRSTMMMRLGGQGVRMAWARPMGYAAQASIEEEVWREPSRPVEAMDSQEKDRGVQWVFLGCPGVGKGTYASRLAKLLEVPHIAMGDLVRNEILQKTSMAEQVGFGSGVCDLECILLGGDGHILFSALGASLVLGFSS